MSLNRRRHDREGCKTPITYSEYCQTDHYEATMYDKSVGGVSFESDIEIQSGLPVCILMPTSANGAEAPGNYEAYVARVKWCQQNGRKNHYKMGAQLLFQGYMHSAGETDKACASCELCENKLFGEVYLTDEPLNLCLGCFKYLGGVLEGCTRDSVIRFIVGNVI